MVSWDTVLPDRVEMVILPELVKVLPPRDHSTVGVGIPLTLQKIVVVFPTVTVVVGERLRIVGNAK